MDLCLVGSEMCIRDRRRRAERQRAAEASIDADPLVRQLREQFAAVVRDGTIEPLEAKA
ncbi:hypothetical protein OE388_01810, partial [Pseudomonas aeruginosa]|nr:hypothetical protein [Pseudomonas aeruginosa]